MNKKMLIILVAGLIVCSPTTAHAEGWKADLNAFPENCRYEIGETWEVPGQWKLTVDDVSITDERSYSNQEPAAVYVVSYTLENTGYKKGSSDELDFTLDLHTKDSADEDGYPYYVDFGYDEYWDPVHIGEKKEYKVSIGVNHPGDFKIGVWDPDMNGNLQRAMFLISTENIKEFVPTFETEEDFFSNIEYGEYDPAYISDDGTVMFDFSEHNIIGGEIDTKGLRLSHGELLDVNQSDGTVVIHAKIQGSYSNKATIDQNFFSVADLICKHGFNTCAELQYWAVADMADGSEGKVISFTLRKEVIDAISDEILYGDHIRDYADDLWILPSLLQ